jgi:hypothetical protein
MIAMVKSKSSEINQHAQRTAFRMIQNAIAELYLQQRRKCIYDREKKIIVRHCGHRT